MAGQQSDQTEADILFEMVKSRYGDRLTEDQLEDVRRTVDSVVGNAEALRAVTLDNADEPPAVFTPYREEG
ncbi:MAG: hypothetical protein IH956_01545 [Chloroflexi bacterium]|nr:hypothetical protein [Chloroflexota bacterium]